MKVKEKAAFLRRIYGCMLTPGMRECKPDVCWRTWKVIAKVNLSQFKFLPHNIGQFSGRIWKKLVYQSCSEPVELWTHEIINTGSPSISDGHITRLR
jgi:hypothetical protein